MQIQVCYTAHKEAICITVDVPEKSTIEKAIECSNIITEYDIDLTKCKVGIYANIMPMNTMLKAGDRVEIYTPAIAKTKRKLG